MVDNLANCMKRVAGELALADIKVVHRSRYMMLTAPKVVPVMVTLPEKPGRWRARKHGLADVRRQVRACHDAAEVRVAVTRELDLVTQRKRKIGCGRVIISDFPTWGGRQ